MTAILLIPIVLILILLGIRPRTSKLDITDLILAVLLIIFLIWFLNRLFIIGN